MSEIFDDAAERALMLGGRPIVKAEELAKVTHIKHEPKEIYTPTEVLEIVLADYKHLLGEFKSLTSLQKAIQQLKCMHKIKSQNLKKPSGC